MSVGRCDDCTRREHADQVLADQGGSDGLEEWPAPMATLGKVWAAPSLPDAPRGPLVLVMVNPPEGEAFRRQGMATMYAPAQFRALVAKMQQIADSLPPDEGIPT